MDKKDIIKQIIHSYFVNELPAFKKRKQKFNFLNVRKIYTIIWPRRAGKTFFLYQIIDKLLKNWIDKKQTLYFFLDRDDIYPVELEDLNTILQTYFEIVGFDKNKKYYIFLDEIQIVENREKFALKVFDQYPNVELIITGSSSKLLSKEIYTWLRWKSFSTQILPLSYTEWLDFVNINLSQLTLEDQIRLNSFFSSLLKYGLFPEIVLQTDEFVKQKLLDEYFDLIYYKDIVERNNFRNFWKLKWFRRILLSYMTDFLNFSHVSKIVNVSENVVLNWFEAFKDAYLVFELKNFDFSIWKQEKSRWKLYVVDNWFYGLNFGFFKEDYWKLFENFVFMKFKKQGLNEDKNIFYFKNSKFDIDFLIFDEDVKFVQVVYELNDNNFEREIGQLVRAYQIYHKPVEIICYRNNLKYNDIPDFVSLKVVNEDISS